MNIEPFYNETIWIIGASTGIGRELALGLAAKGAKLVLSARNEGALQALKKDLKGDSHIILPCDASDSEQIKNSLAELKQHAEQIDRVIFMAGIYEPRSCRDMTIDEINNTTNINLNSALYLVHHILPVLEQQKKAQLVLCASVAGYVGLPKGQPYSATKAAMINLAETLNSEYYDSNIDVKLINPGFVRTRLTDKNKFKMPMIIEADDAAKRIILGLNKKAFEIYFPRRFILFFKFLRILPYWLYFWVVSKL